MRTVTRVVRASGPKSVFEAVELKAAADLASATAEIRARLSKLEAALPLKADAEHVIGLAAASVQNLATAAERDVDHAASLAKLEVAHAARLAELEAKEIDRAAMTVLRRVWAWLTHYEGLV
jgi:hypothetical protein